MVLGSIAPSSMVKDEKTRSGTNGWSRATMGSSGARDERRKRHLSTTNRANYRRLPAAFHDVADFAHPADIGVADARPVCGSGRDRRRKRSRVGAAARAGRATQPTSARRYWLAMFASSARQPAVGADRDLALARAPCAQSKLRPCPDSRSAGPDRLVGGLGLRRRRCRLASGAVSFASAARQARRRAGSTRPSVASGAMIASALRRSTTLPLSSAACWTV